MNMLNEESLKKHLKEVEDLNTMETFVDNLLDKLRAEQNLVKQKVQDFHTWKSGKGQEAFQEEMKDYYEEFTKKIDKVEKTRNSIRTARFNIRLAIANEQEPAGPKF